MSAFVCSDYHINGILQYAKTISTGYFYEGRWYCFNKMTYEELSKVGQILLDENVHAVNIRYEENEVPHKFQFKQIPRLFKPVEILKAINCYEYQTSEDDDYKETLAFKIINYIRDATINSLPEYDKAEGWELHENSN